MQKVLIEKTPDFVENRSFDDIIKSVAPTSFSNEIENAGKSFCYDLSKTFYANNEYNAIHTFVSYSLKQTDTLNSAIITEYILSRYQHIVFHKIGVVRGNVIDKLENANIRVLDDETDSATGVLNKRQKVNVQLHHLQIDDIVFFEYTVYTQNSDSILSTQYLKFISNVPTQGWSYGNFSFNFISGRKENIAVTKRAFRDENNKLLQFPTEIIKTGEKFSFQLTDFCNTYDDQYVNPYIDVASDASWQTISTSVYALYKEFFTQDPRDFAPELTAALDALPTPDDKIQYAIEYTQNNLRYIFDAQDMHGHLPQSPQQTWNLKTGDCKAKSLFLHNVLNYLGIKSTIVLVNFSFGYNYYLQNETPSPFLFNHVILRIDKDGKEYFIDSTLNNEYGYLEYRSQPMFATYLEIAENKTLSIRTPITDKEFLYEQVININVRKGKGTFCRQSISRSFFADSIRRSFVTYTNKELLKWRMQSSLEMLNQKSFVEEPLNFFANGKIEKTKDDKKTNEVETVFVADMPSPYETDKEGSRILRYFDTDFINYDISKHKSKDIPFWVNHTPMKLEIHIDTDEPIFMAEKYTKQEIEIHNKYFTYTLRKNVYKTGASAYIEFIPITNFELSFDDMKEFKDDLAKINDSNFGLGIDFKETGIVNRIKDLFNKKTYGKV